MKTRKRRYLKKKIKGGTRKKTQTPSLTKNFLSMQCSPNPNKNPYSCFDDATILKLKDLWNLRHKDSTNITETEPKAIWTKLKIYLQNVCNKESCWLSQQFASGKIGAKLDDFFAPKYPEEWKKSPNEWLSSVDITNVMKQYEKAYKCFEFMGPTPIDFDKPINKSSNKCVWEELCKFNLKEQIDRKKTKIGIIFNTDTNDGDGEHWISMFINIKKGEIFFYDSAGDSAPEEIKKLSDRIIEQGTKLSPPIKFKYDENHPVEHQMSSTECGVYSLYFIVHMLEDKITAHYLKTHKIKDSYIEKFRKIYFNYNL